MKYAKGFGGSFYCSLREEFCSISELKNRIKEVDEVIKYFTNLHQQTDFTCLAVKYLKELRIEILGEIERREGKPVINGIHVEKMWLWTLRKHRREITAIDEELVRFRREYYGKYIWHESELEPFQLPIDSFQRRVLEECVGTLWHEVYTPEVRKRGGLDNIDSRIRMYYYILVLILLLLIYITILR